MVGFSEIIEVMFVVFLLRDWEWELPSLQNSLQSCLLWSLLIIEGGGRSGLKWIRIAVEDIVQKVPCLLAD